MDELQREVEALRKENQQLRQRVAELEAMVKKLSELLSQNSRNSNWPSSRDKSRGSQPKSQRRPSSRKAGGQKGHQGHTRQLSDTPDEIAVHQPLCCQECQAPLPADAPITEVSRRQVIDLPPLQFVTTEHQVQTKTCQACGASSHGQFPEHVTQPVQYGAGVKQLAVYLRTEQFIPYQRSQQMLNDLFGLPLCVGSLQNFVARAAEQATDVVQGVKQAITAAAVVHADETGFYIGGKRHWLHTASTPMLSYFYPHTNRGCKAIDAADVLPNVAGVLIHDAWQSYFAYDTDHALCHATSSA